MSPELLREVTGTILLAALMLVITSEALAICAGAFLVAGLGLGLANAVMGLAQGGIYGGVILTGCAMFLRLRFGKLGRSL